MDKTDLCWIGEAPTDFAMQEQCQECRQQIHANIISSIRIVSVFPRCPIIASSFRNQKRLGEGLEISRTGLYKEKRPKMNTLCNYICVCVFSRTVKTNYTVCIFRIRISPDTWWHIHATKLKGQNLCDIKGLTFQHTSSMWHLAPLNCLRFQGHFIHAWSPTTMAHDTSEICSACGDAAQKLGSCTKFLLKFGT